jgi:hypothetical protein
MIGKSKMTVIVARKCGRSGEGRKDLGEGERRFDKITMESDQLPHKSIVDFRERGTDIGLYRKRGLNGDSQLPGTNE